MPKRTIAASGELIEESERDSNNSHGCSPWFTADRLDVFGFSLERKQFFVILVLVMFMLGPQGTLGFVIALGAYTVFSRASPPSALMSSQSSSGRSDRWTARVGGASNIRGISDLPCDPRRG